VTIADAGPGAARYETAASWHHHLVCRSCGTIVDVPCVRGSRPCLDAKIPGATIDEAQIIFRGTCVSCAATVPR
jgi:Fur family ferric uptake transcriptional regulator